MRIAVIGAGLAGLYCAHQLTKHHHHVTVFEKSRGRGGRMAVKRLEWGELDIGAQYFTARSAEFRDEVANWEALGLAKRWHFEPHKLTPEGLVLSPDNERRYVGFPSMNSAAKHLASMVNLKLDTRVGRIEFKDSRWHLFDGNDDVLGFFDWVIVALPAEQASDLIFDQSHIGYLIPNHAHTPTWALGLATKGQVAPEIQGVFGDDTVSWLSRLSSKPGRSAPNDASDVWMLHFAPDCSRGLVPEQVKAEGVNWLQQTLNTELEVVHHYQHFWRYANIQPGVSAPPLIDEERRIVAIGDWTQGGRVEGAFLSAQQILNYVFI